MLDNILCWLLGHRPVPCTGTVIDATHTSFEIRCQRCNKPIWTWVYVGMDNAGEKPTEGSKEEA